MHIKAKYINLKNTVLIETLAKFRGNQCGLKYAEAFNILKLVNV